MDGFGSVIQSHMLANCQPRINEFRPSILEYTAQTFQFEVYRGIRVEPSGIGLEADAAGPETISGTPSRSNMATAGPYFFQSTRDQSHGLLTQRSTRDKERGFRTCLEQTIGGSRR